MSAQMADEVSLRVSPGRHFTRTSSQKSIATSIMVVVASGQQKITRKPEVGGLWGARLTGYDQSGER